MLLAGLVAVTFMGAACVVISADSRMGRSAAYALYKWRRRYRVSGQ